MTDELTTAQHAIFTSTTPKNVIKTRQGGGGKVLSYVSADYVIRTLNTAFGFNWDLVILDEKLLPNDQEPREAIVKAQLVIHGPNGQLVKTQFGGQDCKKHNCYACKNDYKRKSACKVCGGTGKGDYISIADDLKGAASDALKKCASMVGIALDLYGNTPEAQPERPTNGNGTRPNGNGTKEPSKPALDLYSKVKEAFDLTPAEFTNLVKECGWDKVTAKNSDAIFSQIEKLQQVTDEDLDF